MAPENPERMNMEEELIKKAIEQGLLEQSPDGTQIDVTEEGRKVLPPEFVAFFDRGGDR
jgi:hypothetical protein